MSSDPQNDSTTLVPTSSAAVLGAVIGNILKGRYLIEKELKRGGFGIVYLAKDLQLHSRSVVVKVLLEESYQNEYVVQKFRQEVEALSRLDHPGVIGIIDAGELNDGKPFLVMQYVDGVSLRSVMKGEGMEMHQAGDIVRQIGRALTAAHERGILHRDLKPENVMLQDLGRDEYQVKVIDFGIAKVKNSVIAPSTVTSVAAGTVSYMAPEQLSGKTVSPATDVYALAGIAYEMLTGRKPFNPETGFALLELQREGVRINPADLRPGIPTAAQQTILRSLSFDPATRQQSAREFGDELASSLEHFGSAESTRSIDPAPTQLATELTPNIPAITEKTVPATFPIPITSTPEDDSHARGPIAGQSRTRSKIPLVTAGLVLLLVIFIGAFYFVYKRNSTSTPTIATTAPTRTFNYWLTVQKMRDGREYQEPFESSGQEIFEDGWKFRVNFSSPDAGYLYLLNDGQASSGTTTLTLLFPNPFTNSGSPYLSAAQSIQTGWMLFDKNQGTEKFWIVWSTTGVPELEAVKGVVNNVDQGTVKDGTQVEAIRKFLAGSGSNVEAQKDGVRKQTNVKTNQAVVVFPLELEHH